MIQPPQDTIAAIATGPGRGGIGIVRISGPDAATIATAIADRPLAPRHAVHCRFIEHHGEQDVALIDEGIALYFPAPASFTGEDVVELQGHGGPVILDCLLREVIRRGARAARAGEFSERAFLNDKLDLAQAEAIADLIDASSEQAARSAVRSLQGAFSQRIHALVEQLIALRVYVEAAIDFPEEEIDFLADGRVATDLDKIIAELEQTLGDARQGSLLREGMTVVIAGRPNAGKSSLLNALARRDSAIVTDIAGTTRDILREHIQIDGMPLHVIDTAGLRESQNQVERIGIERAWEQIRQADRVLLVVDATASAQELHASYSEFTRAHPEGGDGVTVILNKCDLSGHIPGVVNGTEIATIALSARTGAGLDALHEHLKSVMGYHAGDGGIFMARRRHIEALQRAHGHLLTGRDALQAHTAGELLADDLLRAQQALGEITGEFTADDLLGRIFSSFCIGK